MAFFFRQTLSESESSLQQVHLLCGCSSNLRLLTKAGKLKVRVWALNSNYSI